MPLTIDIAVVLPVILQIIALITAISVGIVWLRKWLRKQVAEPMVEAKRQLEPNGGPMRETTRHLIEETSKGVTDLQNRVGDISMQSIEHKALIAELSQRLDRHIIVDHGKAE